jgi:hypothetical protein
MPHVNNISAAEIVIRSRGWPSIEGETRNDQTVERRDSLRSTGGDDEVVDPAHAFQRAARLTCGLGVAFAALF